jgi:hypothetical protein
MNIVEYGVVDCQEGNNIFSTGDIFEVRIDSKCEWRPYMLVITYSTGKGMRYPITESDIWMGVLVDIRSGGILSNIMFEIYTCNAYYLGESRTGHIWKDEFDRVLKNAYRNVSWKRIGPVIMDIKEKKENKA